MYKGIHYLSKQISDVEKALKEIKNSKDSEETIEYVKNELRQKLLGLSEKIKEQDTNINAFIALYNFRTTQEFMPETLKRADSISKKSRAMLSSIDPLIGKIPSGFEEEKECLLTKLKDCKQRVYSLDTNLKEDKKPDNSAELIQKIEDTMKFCKMNKKRIEELAEKTKKSITETSENLTKVHKEDLQKLNDALLAKIKELKGLGGGSGVDDATVQSLREDLKVLFDRSNLYNDRLNKLEKLTNDHEDLLNRISRAIEAKANKKDHKDLANQVETIQEKLKMLLDQVNSIKIPAPMMMADDSNKYQELERILVALEDKMDRTVESLSQRMNDINKFMDMIKEDVDKSLEEQEKQLLKALGKTNI